jgi:acetyl-CoA carboxylase biotin carboxyl carrier protein
VETADEKRMDIKHIKNLIALMIENDLSQIEIQEGETHILLKRGPATGARGVPTVVAAPPPAAARAGSVAAPVPPTELASAAPPETHIRSPMVGTFYTAPDPESPPFVSVGDVVDPDTVVCLVEAMKVFNEIKAEVSGRLTKVLVNNAEAVEYDQPLFVVAPV